MESPLFFAEVGQEPVTTLPPEGWQLALGEPITGVVLLSAIVWLSVTKGIPALWSFFAKENERDDRRYDDLLLWIKEYLVSSEASMRTMQASLVQQQETLTQIRLLLALHTEDKVLNPQEDKKE